MNNTYNQNTPKVVGATVISMIIVVALYVFFIKDNTSVNQQQSVIASTSDATISSNTNESSVSQSSSNTNTSTTQPTVSASSYKDGTYTKSINYRVPNGTNSLTVTMVIKNGLVDSVKTSSNYADYESQYYISGFENSINTSVKGKQLSSLSIGRIGGASLTSNAFNSAIKSIRTDAA